MLYSYTLSAPRSHSTPQMTTTPLNCIFRLLTLSVRSLQDTSATHAATANPKMEVSCCSPSRNHVTRARSKRDPWPISSFVLTPWQMRHTTPARCRCGRSIMRLWSIRAGDGMAEKLYSEGRGALTFVDPALCTTSKTRSGPAVRITR